MRTNKLKLTSIALGLCALLGAAACDDEATEPADNGEEGGKVARAGKGGGGGKGGEGAADAGGQDTADEGGKGGAAGKGGSGAKAGAGGEDSESDSCFDGEAKETDEFLNHCTDSECEPFDNAERLPLLGDDGKLPALP